MATRKAWEARHELHGGTPLLSLNYFDQAHASLGAVSEVTSMHLTTCPSLETVKSIRLASPVSRFLTILPCLLYPLFFFDLLDFINEIRLS